MKQLTLRADEVAVGDYIWNGGKVPAYQWVRVVRVSLTTTRVRLEHGGLKEVSAVEIQTTSWTTVKTRGEGVAVRRRGE